MYMYSHVETFSVLTTHKRVQLPSFSTTDTLRRGKYIYISDVKSSHQAGGQS